MANPGMRWPDLDRLLVQIWESHSIRTRVVQSGTVTEGAEDWVEHLMPESVKRRIVDFAGERVGLGNYFRKSSIAYLFIATFLTFQRALIALINYSFAH